MDHHSPLADIEQRMQSAALDKALLVETWNGANRSLLMSVLDGGQDHRFLVGMCHRPDNSEDQCRLLKHTALAGVRMLTADVDADHAVCRELDRREKLLITHAESGIGHLCRTLVRTCGALPGLRIYVPHIGWPMKEGSLDPDWEPAMKELTAIPSIIFGISAIPHFSRCPFPHNDVRDTALELIARLPLARIAIGSDYPLMEKDRYDDYLRIARTWVTSIYPEWSFTF